MGFEVRKKVKYEGAEKFAMRMKKIQKKAKVVLEKIQKEIKKYIEKNEEIHR